jgi:lipopolysaccharide transport system ATP-binding protein
MDKGTVQAQGKSGDVIDKYNDHVRMQNSVSIVVPDRTVSEDDDLEDNEQLTAQLLEARLLDVQDEEDEFAIYQTGDPFRVRLVAKKQLSLALDDVHIGVIIKRNDGVQCFGMSTAVDGVSLFSIEKNKLGVDYEIPKLNLLSGQYSLEIWLIDSTSAHIYDSIKSCCDFKVKQPSTEVGVTYMPHRWGSPE